MKRPTAFLFCLLFLKTTWLSAQIVVAADKMNAVYPVVDNPISVVVSDVPDGRLLVTASMGELRKMDTLGHYIWHFCQRTSPEAALALRDTVAGEEVGVMRFRVQNLPKAVPFFGPKQPCANCMYNGDFRAQGGISMVFQNFDFDLKADVVSYDVGYVSPNQDPVEKHNIGGRWNAEVAELVKKARPGDVFYFDNIRYRVSCDPVVREAGGLVFKIK